MGVLGGNWWWVWAVAAKMVFLGGKNEVSADFSVNFQKSAYIAYDCIVASYCLVDLEIYHYARFPSTTSKTLQSTFSKYRVRILR